MSNTPSPALLDRLRGLIPLAVFLVAFGFRLIGIGWGLPNDLHNDSYHPDEPVIFGYSQAVEPLKYPWTPHFYNYGTLYLVVERIASDMTAAYTGGYDPKDPKSVYAYIGRCELAGRVISALAGAGTALIVLLILRRLTSEFGAVLGSLLLAFAPGFVVHSRFETVDVFATFLLAVSAFFALRILALTADTEGVDRVLHKNAVWAGVFAGLSAGTKYTGILGLLTLLAVLVLHPLPGRWKALFLGGVTGMVTFLVVTPGALFDSAKFWTDTMFEMQLTKTGHGLVFAGTSSGFLYQISNLFLGIGTILALVAAGGLIFAAWKRQAWAIALLAFMVPYYILIGQAQDKYLRYSFPLYIGLAAGFGWAMAKAHERKGWGHGVVGLGLLGLGGVLDPGGLRSAATFTYQMVATDPRDAVGKRFHELAASQDAVVGLANDPWYYTPALYPEVARMRSGNYAAIDGPMRASDHPKVERFIPKAPDGTMLYPDRKDWDARLLTESKPDYVVFSNFEKSQIEQIKAIQSRTGEEDQLVRQYDAFMRELQARYAVQAVEGTNRMGLVQDMMYVVPTVYVWKRKDLP